MSKTAEKIEIEREGVSKTEVCGYIYIYREREIPQCKRDRASEWEKERERERERQNKRERERDIYIYYCGVIIWSKFGLLRGYYLVQVCFFLFSLVCQKHYKIGVSALFWTKKLRTKISGVTIWSKSAFLKRTQLGPDNNPYLDQIITPQNVFFFVIVCF